MVGEFCKLKQVMLYDCRDVTDSGLLFLKVKGIDVVEHIISQHRISVFANRINKIRLQV